MATRKQKDAETDEVKAQREALSADPPYDKAPIDVAQERAAEEGERLGYVDPKSQEVPEGYQPDPDDVKDPKVRETRANKVRNEARKAERDRLKAERKANQPGEGDEPDVDPGVTPATDVPVEGGPSSDPSSPGLTRGNVTGGGANA